jgi:anti-sigma-K factor RskA
MSGISEEHDLLAAEYVLGTLDPQQAREVAARAKTDPALAQAITAWEERLAPLALSVPPVAPPASLWRCLSASIAPQQDSALIRAWRSVALWRGATAAGFAVAAALAAVLLVRPTPRPAQSVAALVPAGSAAAAYLAELQPDGTLRLVALRPVPVAAGKDLELWALPSGATRPVPLGVLPAAGSKVAPPHVPAHGTQLMISLEPQGGSPTGLPTGPVLYAGTLQGAE